MELTMAQLVSRTLIILKAIIIKRLIRKKRMNVRLIRLQGHTLSMMICAKEFAIFRN
jgi:hypothetical protein